MTGTEYADDLALLANTSVQVESLLHSLAQAAGSISHSVNASKIESMCFKPLNLVDRFTYLESNISSTESEVNICIGKAQPASDRLFTISDLSDKIRFLPSCGYVSTYVWMHHLDSNKMHEVKTSWELYKNAMCCFKQILETAAHKTAIVKSLTSHLQTIQVR